MNLEQQKKQAGELLRAVRSGNGDVLARLRRHHLRWAQVEDASFVIAREQWFASWTKLKAYAESSTQAR